MTLATPLDKVTTYKNRMCKECLPMQNMINIFLYLSEIAINFKIQIRKIHNKRIILHAASTGSLFSILT